jgi:hypothetical protein
MAWPPLPTEKRNLRARVVKSISGHRVASSLLALGMVTAIAGVLLTVSEDGDVLSSPPASVLPRGTTHEASLDPTSTPSSTLSYQASGVVAPAPSQEGPPVGDSPSVTAVRVPNLLGRQSPRAVKVLESLGYVPVIEERPSDYPPGIVIRIRPLSGTRLAVGKKVTLTVARSSTLPSQAPCSPYYVDVCIPDVPYDLDCEDLPFTNIEVSIGDPYRLDDDGDGIACEASQS